jgi:hypothetical protein
MKGYPVVYPDDDWCMQHKMDEVYVENKKAREDDNKAIDLLKEDEKTLGGFPENTIDR